MSCCEKESERGREREGERERGEDTFSSLSALFTLAAAELLLLETRAEEANPVSIFGRRKRLRENESVRARRRERVLETFAFSPRLPSHSPLSLQ